MKPRNLNINPVLNGFIIQVGCQTVVFDDIDKMGAAIVKYYRNPEATEKEWLAKPLNRTMDGPCEVPQANTATHAAVEWRVGSAPPEAQYQSLAGTESPQLRR